MHSEWYICLQLNSLASPPHRTPPCILGSASRSSDALLLFSPLESSQLSPHLLVAAPVGHSVLALQLVHRVVVQ